jgi:DinB superfamily
MTEISKAELIEALRENGAHAVETLRSTPEAAFEQGRYENGWNGRQILAHIASIEWTYRKLIDVAKQAPSEAPRDAAPPAGSGDVRRTTAEESRGLPTAAAQGGIDSYNARQVEKRAAASVAELIDEFEENRAGTIAAVEATDEALLQTSIRSAGGITGQLGGVIQAVSIAHVQMHVADITGAEWTGPRF